MDILHFLNVLIGFSMVMFILSVTIGSITQIWMTAIRNRKKTVVDETLMSMLIDIGIDEGKAKKLIEDIGNNKDKKREWYDFIWDISNNGSKKYISREGLMFYLLKTAAYKPNNNLLDISGDLYKIEQPVTPTQDFQKYFKETLEKIEKEISNQEVINYKDPSYLWYTKAFNLYVPNLAAKLFTRFDSEMDKADDILKRHGKLVSAILAIPALLFFQPVDSIQLINKLNSDKVLSEKLATQVSDDYINKFNEKSSICINDLALISRTLY